jgi:SAM-dependent methyltransferase
MFWPDVIDLKQFYATTLGEIACESIRSSIRQIWPAAKGDVVLGIGFTHPYLLHGMENAERVISCMPAPQGVIHWPLDRPNLTLLGDEGELPFADNSINRVLVVHALENSEQVRRMMQEVWRVLTPTGRVLVVVPNRRGIWARSALSPFANGRPYTFQQLRNLLFDNSLTPLQTRSALFFMPTRWKFLLRSAKYLDRLGRIFYRYFGGVILMEAEKQIYAPTKQVRVQKYSSARIYAPAAKPVLNLKRNAD